MGRASNGARRNVDLAWISLGISDELGNRLGRNRWMHHQDGGHDNNAGDRRDVADKIETKLFVQRSIDRVCRSDKKERVAIRGRTHDGLGGYIATSTWPVLDDEWRAEPFRQPLAHQTCGYVETAASGSADYQAHRPRRISLRRSEA